MNNTLLRLKRAQDNFRLAAQWASLGYSDRAQYAIEQGLRLMEWSIDDLENESKVSE